MWNRGEEVPFLSSVINAEDEWITEKVGTQDLDDGLDAGSPTH